MGLTKIHGFSGDAEIQGTLRSVQYSNGALTLFGMTLDDAYQVLDSLSLKTVVAVRVKAGTRPEVIQENAKPPQPEKFLSHQSVEAPQKSEAPFKAPSKPEPAIVKTAEQKDAELLEFPPKGTVSAADPPAGIPEEVATSKRFIVVLDWVMKTKKLTYKQVDALVAEMEQLKDLPAVSRVRDIRDKVLSNVAAYEEAGDAA